MKTISFLICLGFVNSVFAGIWNCPIQNGVNSNERIVVEFESALSSVTYIHQVPNGDGTFAENPESLFSVKDKIRGGIPVAFCESDDGHVALEYKMINWSSRCSTKEDQDPLFFKADFRQDQVGYVQVQIIDVKSKKDFQRIVRTDACK